MSGECTSPKRRRPCDAGASDQSGAVQARTELMNAAAKSNRELDAAEVEMVVESLRCVADSPDEVDWDALRTLLRSTAHETHRVWENTEKFADRLQEVLGGPDDANFASMFQRVLQGGNWEKAEASALKRGSSSKPWVVLVSGLNGIRKTTSVYQPWFKEVLSQALGKAYTGLVEELPCGRNSFFRCVCAQAGR